jgi:mono/diheme cytochrome c family protein
MPGLPVDLCQEAAVLKPFLMASAFVVLGVPALFQQAAPPAPSAPPAAATNQFNVPPDYLAKVNPIKPTAESQAYAKKQYGWDCAMCHGANGDGKGDVAAEQKLQLRDYRDPATLKSMSDGEIYYIIEKGKGQMPAEGDRAKPEQIWNLVIYIRKMANGEAPPASQPGQ